MSRAFVTEDPLAHETPHGTVLVDTGAEVPPLWFRTRGHYTRWLRALLDQPEAADVRSEPLFHAPWVSEQQEAEAAGRDYYDRGRAS